MRNKKFKMVLLLATVLSCVSTQNVLAADINNLSDLTNQNNYTSNATLNIKRNINLGPNARDGALLPHIQNATNVVVNGNGRTISGQLQAQEDGDGLLIPAHYLIDNSQVSFNSIIYDSITTNCISSQGITTRNYTIDGGLFNNASGQLLLDNITFSKNDHHVDITRADYADIGSYINGGVINTSNSTSLNNVKFEQNTIYTRAYKNRGAVMVGSPDINSKIVGGLIYNNSNENSTANLEIKDGTFSSNIVSATTGNEYDNGNQSASILGGLIYNNGNLSIDGTSFNSNSVSVNVPEGSANALGATIYNDTNSSLNIKNASFANNILASDRGEALGGAIYNKGHIDIANTTFSNNRAGIDDDINDSNITTSLNDIYFESGSSMNVTSGGDVQIGSGLESRDDSANITVSDGGNLVMVSGNDSSKYLGSVDVTANGLLSFKGSTDALNSLDNAKSVTLSGNLAGFGYSFNEDYTLQNADLTKFTITDNVKQLQIVKSGSNTLTIGNDLNDRFAKVIINEGKLAGSDGSYFSQDSETIVNNSGTFEYSTSQNVFDKNVQLVNGGSLSIIGNGIANEININNDKVKFTGENSVILNNATYIMGASNNTSSNQNFVINNSNLKFENTISEILHNVTLNNSTLDLEDNNTSDIRFNSLSSVGNSNLTIDVDFVSGESDVIDTGSGTGSINLSGINFITSSDSGVELEKTFHVLDGGMTFNQYSSDNFDSGVYIYDVDTNNQDVTLSAIANSVNGLKLQNQKSGNRSFYKLGSDDYKILSDLGKTAEGEFTVGKAAGASNNVISGDKLYSFFEVGENTTLNINDLVFTDAKADSIGDSTNVNGAVVSQNGGIVNIKNSTLQNSTAEGLGGAIYVENGQMNINSSTISGNSAQNGGGIYVTNGANVNISNTTFENNSAVSGMGSAIYNDGGNINLTDVVLNNNKGDYPIYNKSGELTLGFTKDTTFSNGSGEIYNSGILNIYTNNNLTISDGITSEITEDVSNNIINVGNSASGNAYAGNVTLAAVEYSTINANNGDLTLNSINNSVVNSNKDVVNLLHTEDSLVNVNNGSVVNLVNASGNDVLNTDLNINSGTVNLNNGNISGGNITFTNDGILNLKGQNTNISSNLSGLGTINQENKTSLVLSGNNQAFNGNLNILGTLDLNEVSALGSDAQVNLNNAILNYTLSENSEHDVSLEDTAFADVNLKNGSVFNITGKDRSQNITVGNGLWTSDGNGNSLNFSSGSFMLGNHLATTDLLTFNNSNVTLVAGTDAYNLNLQNSTLDLSNKIAGNTYNINNLDSENSSFSVDVSLIHDETNYPIADKIKINSGSGILDLTKIYITGDNGNAAQTGETILIFNGTKDVGLAIDENVEILSWATNVYKYGIESAKIYNQNYADGIKVVPKGFSSTDTLRDLNMYHGSRGFNYVIGAKDENFYNIYRDLDTTSEGTFTILGLENNGSKSILSGELKDLVVEKDSNRLILSEDKSTYTYYDSDLKTVSGTFANTPENITTNENGDYVIKVGVLGNKNETNGSFFELVNNSELELSNLNITKAKRYATDDEKIKDGSVIYANNTDANVRITNTDFTDNEVLLGNGGAIANELSKSFLVNGSVFSGNVANKNGGAIYNSSTGELALDNVEFYENSAQGDGGALYNTGSNLTISNAKFHSNSAKGKGGAIYTSADMTIVDSDFGSESVGLAKVNTAENGEWNDIYLANNANVTFSVTNSENNIYSGIAGEAGTKFIKDGVGTLNLSGVNENMLGEFEIRSGKVYYQQAEDIISFVSGMVNLSSENSELEMDIFDDLESSIYGLTGQGNVIKNGDGLLHLTGDNKNFNGKLSINNGKVLFEGSNAEYISGTTEIAQNSELEYNTDKSDSVLNNVLGSGTINKTGTGVLNFTRDENFNGKIVSAGSGTLNVNDQASDSKLLNMLASDGSIINYISNSDYIIDKSTGISFNGSNNKINLINGSYDLNADIANSIKNNVLGFEDATLKLGSTNYNTGKYVVKNSTIDLSGDGQYNTYQFKDLTTEGDVNLAIDVNFKSKDSGSSTSVAPSTILSDKLVSDVAGEIKLTNLKFGDDYQDYGLYNPVEIEVLGGNLVLNTVDPIDFATDVYEYDLSISEDKQSVILTAVNAATADSLGAQNRKNGTRIFTFTNKDNNPYQIAKNLGNTGTGTFTVNGVVDKSGSILTTIDGSDKYSMFNVVNDKTVLNINDVNIQNAKTVGNGSVVNQTSKSGITNITNAVITNNTSGNLGGAIYAGAGTVNLTDVALSGNKSGTSLNDIYVSKDAIVNFNAKTAGKNEIASGISGSGLVNKLGKEDLQLSGNNKDFNGQLNITSGAVNFEQKTESDTYISGLTNLVNSSSKLQVNNSYKDITSGAFTGKGQIEKNGERDLTITGNNSTFSGETKINGGNIKFNTDDTTYLGGKTIISQDGGIKIEGNNGTQLKNISGTGTITKDNTGILLFQGKNDFSGNLNINNGTLGLGVNSSLGNINHATFADGTSINLQNTTAVQGSDGIWTTSPDPSSIENLVFDNLTLQGNTKLYLDVDLAKSVADTITVNNMSNSTGKFILGQNSLNIVSDALVKNTQVEILKGEAVNNVILEEAAKVAMGPIQKYDVNYLDGKLLFTGQGGFTPSIDEVNPSVMASPVAAQLGGYLVQLQSYDEAFRNMDMYMLMTKAQRQALKLRNKYAILDNNAMTYDPLLSKYDNNAGWFRSYATFENVRLDNGPKVSNVAYGTYFGGDSKLYDLGHGWDGMWSAYVGYNGSHQAYSGVGMYQNGGTLGVTGVAYKGNFFTGLTANVGANVGEANTMFGHENFAMLMTGIASKTGYNFELADGKFVIQPSLLMSYSFVNTFDYTNAAGVSISSDPLHAIQLEPGIKLIANLKNGWQPYLGVSMVWSIMDNTQFMANTVSLPSLSVDPYVKYGVGVRKSWGERLVGYFQTYLTNGGRNGVGLQLGFRWTLGKDSYEDVKVHNKVLNETKNRKVLKCLK